MLRQLLRNRLCVVLHIAFCLIAIGGVYKSLWYPQSMEQKKTDDISSLDTRKQTTGVQRGAKPSSKLPVQKNNFKENRHSFLPTPTTQISKDKLEKISELYGHRSSKETSWATMGPPRAEIEILVEGMDNLSAARYLRMQSGYDEFVREYAAKALNEDPDNFDALYIFTQAQDLETDRETGFRKLLEIDPNFVPALSKLGVILARDSPEEAIEYLERANQLEPDNNLFHLGISYQRVGEYDKALVVLKRADELNRAPMAQAHIQAIEAGTPRVPLIQREVEEPLQPETEEQETGNLLPESDPSTHPESMEAETERSPTESPQTHTEDRQQEEDIRAFFEQMSEAEFAAFKQLITKEFPELLPKDLPELPTDANVEPSPGEDQALARFSPERLNRAMETLNRYGPEEGLRKLQKEDPEIAKQVGRLINRKPPQQENDAPPE